MKRLILLITAVFLFGGCGSPIKEAATVKDLEDIVSSVPEIDTATGRPTGKFVVTCKDGSRLVVPPSQLASPQICSPQASRQFTGLFGRFSSFCSIDADGILQCFGDDTNHQTKFPEFLPTVKKVAVNLNHSCAIDGDEHLHCWGNNNWGAAQLPDDLSPARIMPYNLHIKDVAVGRNTTCAILDQTIAGNTNVRCWGTTNLGETQVPANLKAKTIYGGLSNYCAINQNDAVQCWGIYSVYRHPPAELDKAESMAIGTNHACAIRKSDQKVICWGDGEEGQLNVPPDLGPVQKLSAGPFHTCAVTTAGELKCWGKNNEGQIYVPSSLGAVREVVAGDARNCVIRGSGDVRCWDFASDELKFPYAMTALNLFSGPNSVCATQPANTLSCWGQNEAGEITRSSSFQTQDGFLAIGDGHSCIIDRRSLSCAGDNRYGQGVVPPGGNFNNGKMVAAGSHFNCFIRADDTLTCWGDNRFGQTSVPENFGKVRSVAAGDGHVCAAAFDGKVRCWGLNDDGQATPPAGLAATLNVVAGRQHTCAISATAKVQCWGRNFDGQALVPASLDVVQQVTAGAFHTCAVEAGSQRLICWGDNQFGQSAVPADLGAVSKVVAGQAHTCALRARDSQVVCWGQNNYNQLVPRSSSTGGGFNPGNWLDFLPINQGSLRRAPYGEDLVSCRTQGGAYLCTASANALHSIASLSDVDPYDLQIQYEAAGCPGSFGFVTGHSPFVAVQNGGSMMAVLKNNVGPSSLYFKVKAPIGHVPADDFASFGDCRIKIINVAIKPSAQMVRIFGERAKNLNEIIRIEYDNWLVISSWSALAQQTEQQAALNMKLKLSGMSAALITALNTLNKSPASYGINSPVWNENLILDGITKKVDVGLRTGASTLVTSTQREFISYFERPLWYLDAMVVPGVKDNVRKLEQDYNIYFGFLKLPTRYTGTGQGEDQARDKVLKRLAEAGNFLDLTRYIRESLDASIVPLVNRLLDAVKPLYDNYCASQGRVQQVGYVKGLMCH
jgi:alpha-tubulin suppressor-like RCC1 family protein